MELSIDRKILRKNFLGETGVLCLERIQVDHRYQ